MGLVHASSLRQPIQSEKWVQSRPRRDKLKRKRVFSSLNPLVRSHTLLNVTTPTITSVIDNTKMSSPSHRRQRSSVSGTPKRSSRRSSQALPSSPPDPSAAQLLGEAASSQTAPGTQGTPLNGRQPPVSSSPMFFRSSPAPGGPVGVNMDISSPLRQVSTGPATTDGDRTPRANQLIGGMHSPIFISTSLLTISQIRHRYDTPQAPAQTEGCQLDRLQIFAATAVGCLSAHRAQWTPRALL